MPILGFMSLVLTTAAFAYVYLTRKSTIQRRLKRKLAPDETDTESKESDNQSEGETKEGAENVQGKSIAS